MDQRTAGLLREGQLVTVEADLHQITETYLSGSYEIRQRVDQKALDGTFQVSRAVLVIDTFLQQHVLCFVGALEYKLGPGGHHDAILHGLQLEIENLA